MRANRNFTNIFNWILDNLVPPLLRDCRIIMRLLFYPLFGNKSRLFMNFKERALSLTETEMAEYYRDLADKHIQRETDLNRGCADLILSSLKGTRILDVGCGRGYLLKRIAEDPKYEVWGCDFVLHSNLSSIKGVHIVEANIAELPFVDGFFDTVICSHTLEHVVDLDRAISELRRVSRERLIAVVPRQREYKYTFDLHVNFFPYVQSFQRAMKNANALCMLVSNDIFYMEDKR